MTNPATHPRFRLAPGTVLAGGRRPPLPATPAPAPAPGEFRNTSRDRPALAVSVDPTWLLAPLYARDAAGLTPTGQNLPGQVHPPIPAGPVTADRDAATADWPTWWAGALAYRPGVPAPRPEDLFAGSAALRDVWSQLAPGFAGWLAARPPGNREDDAPARAAERAALAGFAHTHGRAPGRWTVRILQIPVTGRYLHSPAPRRLVVSRALRADPDAYAGALAAELPSHF